MYTNPEELSGISGQLGLTGPKYLRGMSRHVRRFYPTHNILYIGPDKSWTKQQYQIPSIASNIKNTNWSHYIKTFNMLIPRKTEQLWISGKALNAEINSGHPGDPQT